MTRISSPGIYDISNDTYHSDCCDGPSASASDLIALDQSCPALWWANSHLNPARPPEEPTPALLFGRAAHMLILEGEEIFRRSYAVKPQGLDGRTREGKAWLAEHADIDTISHDDALRAQAMAEAVRAHPLCGNALVDGAPERSLICRDEATGLWLKTRPDWLPHRRPGKPFVVPNYKTALTVQPDAWTRQAFGLGYHQAAALMVDVVTAVTGEAPIAYWIAQEKEPPYLVQPFVMEEGAIEWGRRQNRRALDRLARCIETGVWPGYSDGVVTVAMPTFIERRLADAEAAAGNDQQQGEAA